MRFHSSITLEGGLVALTRIDVWARPTAYRLGVGDQVDRTPVGDVDGPVPAAVGEFEERVSAALALPAVTVAALSDLFAVPLPVA